MCKGKGNSDFIISYSQHEMCVFFPHFSVDPMNPFKKALHPNFGISILLLNVPVVHLFPFFNSDSLQLILALFFNNKKQYLRCGELSEVVFCAEPSVGAC